MSYTLAVSRWSCTFYAPDVLIINSDAPSFVADVPSTRGNDVLETNIDSRIGQHSVFTFNNNNTQHGESASDIFGDDTKAVSIRIVVLVVTKHLPGPEQGPHHI